jgi:hypothetical protein
MGLQWEMNTQHDPPVGGYSSGTYWEDSPVCSGYAIKPDLEIGGPKPESLREQYEIAYKKPEKYPEDYMRDIIDQVRVEQIKAQWNALVQAFGEEKAREARKFYDVEAIPKDIDFDTSSDTTKMNLEFSIVIKPKNLAAPVIACEACDFGFHEGHKEASKKEPCDCACVTEGET